MDHNEAVRKFEHLMLKQADQAQEAATELAALVLLLPNEKSRELAQFGEARAHFRLGFSKMVRHQQNVCARREMREQPAFLNHVTDPAP